MIELICLKVSVLIRQAHPKNALILTTDIFLNKAFGFRSTVFNGCHDVFRMSIEIYSIVF